MCCGKGCTPHRPLVNAHPEVVSTSRPEPARTPVDVVQEPRPVGVETRRNGRWHYGTTRPLTDVQEAYDGGRTGLPRADNRQVDQMEGVLPTPQTSQRRTAVRDTGSGGGCP